jgi:hypothetical protein
MKRVLFVISIASLILLSCNPFRVISKEDRKLLRQKKKCERIYNKYKRSCPENVRVDTFILEVSTSVDSQNIARNFHIPTDTILQDSIRSRFQRTLDSLAADLDSVTRSRIIRLHSNSVRTIGNRRVIEGVLEFDTTITIMVDNRPYELKIQANVTQPNINTITVGIIVPKQEIKTEIKVPDEKLTEPVFTTLEKIQMWLNGAWLSIIIVLAVLVVLYIFRKFLRNIIR